MIGEDVDDGDGSAEDAHATTTDDETGPAADQGYVQDARAVVAIKRAILDSNLRRVQALEAPDGTKDEWDAAIGLLRRAAGEEKEGNVHAAPSASTVKTIKDAADAVDGYCRGRVGASASEVELAARAKTAAGIIVPAGAGLPRRAPAKDWPPPSKGKKQLCSRCQQPGHKVTSCEAPAIPPRAVTPAQGPKCTDCFGGVHKPGDRICPVQRLSGGNKEAYDRGVDPNCKDPLSNDGRQTRACVVPVRVLARAVFDDGGSAATRSAVADALQHELEALAEASTKLRFLMLRVLDVALRDMCTTVAGNDWEAAMPTEWTPVWLWLAYACGCEGAAGSPLAPLVKCGVCGTARANTRMANKSAGLADSYPSLMASLAYGLEQVLGVASPACDRYLPASNHTARWEPVATIVANHVERCVQAACRKLGSKAAEAVLLATPAAADGAAAGVNYKLKLARSAAVRFSAGTAGRATRGRRLKGVPDAVPAALETEVSTLWANVPASAAALFPVTAARSRRWWLYVPFLLHVLTVGVQRPYSLVPGARAALHAHGTMVPAKMLALLRTVSAATGAPVRGHASLRAWPELTQDGAAVLAAMAGVGGRRNRASSQLSTDGVAVTFFLSRPDTPAEAEARAADSARRQTGADGRRKGGAKGGGVAVRAGVLTQLERSGLPLASVRRMQVVGVDPGRSTTLSAAPGERIATADLPARPVVDAMRATWARRLGLDALNRACAALLRAKGVPVDGVAEAVGGPRQTQAKKSKRAASGAAGNGGRVAKRRAPPVTGQMGVVPSAHGTAKTHQSANPGRGHARVRRGPVAAGRREGRTKLAAAVRRVLGRTRLCRWTVPRHETEAVAARLTAFDGGCWQGLLARVQALPKRKGRRRLAPISGMRYKVSAAHFREASGGNFRARAWKRWRARAGETAAGRTGTDADALPPVDEAAAHDTMRTGDREAHLQATRQWVALRETAAYRARFGADATRGVRSAHLHQIIQRGRFAAAVARDLTGGLLRSVRGGVAVIVSMGTARVRGGDGWMRRYLRRLCWLVDQDEFNTSQACAGCHEKLVLVYPTGNSPPTLPTELFGPPVTAPARRVRMAAGSRRGQPKRPVPSADHKTRRGSEVDTFRAAARASARASAVARRSAELATCAVEDRCLYKDGSGRCAWSVKACVSAAGPSRPDFVNRDCIAAVNMAWATARRLTYTNGWPFKRPHSMRWSWTTKCPPNVAPVDQRRRERATTRVDAWPSPRARHAVNGSGGGVRGQCRGCGAGAGGADQDTAGGGLFTATRQRDAPVGNPTAVVDSATDGARRMETVAAEEPDGLVAVDSAHDGARWTGTVAAGAPRGLVDAARR